MPSAAISERSQQSRGREVEDESEHEEDEESVGKVSAGLTAKAGGAPLPEGVRGKMENSLGADFSAVRVHQGAEAASVGAEAYAHGQDIHFAPGKYDPGSQQGQELLGHELSHVVQQRGAKTSIGPQARGTDLAGTPALEAEADVAGAKAARGEKAHVSSGTGGGIQFKRPKVPNRTFLDTARDAQVPAMVKEHFDALKAKLGSKAELQVASADGGDLVKRLDAAATAHAAAQGSGSDAQKADMTATAGKIAARSNAVKDAISSKSEAIAGEIATAGGHEAAFASAARAAFDTTTVGTTVISEKLIIQQARASAWLALRKLDDARYNLAKTALDQKLAAEKAAIELSLTTDSKSNVEERAKAANTMRGAKDAELTTITNDAATPLYDALWYEIEKDISTGLGADSAHWWRSDEVKAFRKEMKTAARATAGKDIAGQIAAQGGGEATKRHADSEARIDAHQRVKESISEKLHEYAEEGTNAVFLTKTVKADLDAATRQAAFAVFEDGDKKPAAIKAAVAAAKAKVAAIKPGVKTAATAWKNEIIRKGDEAKAKPVVKHDEVKAGVIEHVKTNDGGVAKKSVEAAMKSTGPSDGMGKFGTFLDGLLPERGDAVKFKVTLEIPAGPGSVLLELQGDAERGTRDRIEEHGVAKSDSQSLKIGAELRIGYMGALPGVKLSGTLGFFMRADTESTNLTMKAMSYGIYRFLTSACAPLANLWGGSSAKANEMADATPDDPTAGGAPGNKKKNDLKDDVYRSELWASMVEEQVFAKDKDARVDLGGSANFGAEVNAGVAKFKGGLRGEVMRTYDQKGLAGSLDTHNTAHVGGKQHSLGDATFDKDEAAERRKAIQGRTTGAFIFEAETEVKLGGQAFVFGLKLKIAPNGDATDWELEISGGLKITSADPSDAKLRLIAGIVGAATNGVRTIIGVIRTNVDEKHPLRGSIGNIIQGLQSGLMDANNIANNAIGARVSDVYQIASTKQDGVNQTLNHAMGGTTSPDEATKAGGVQEMTYKGSLVMGSGPKFLIKVDEVQSTKLGLTGSGVGATIEYEKSRRVGQIGMSNGKFTGDFLGLGTK